MDQLCPETRNISLQDLYRLLGDRVFVDYLNVFLSLPIFSQRMLYRFNSKDFEFDPPITRANMVIEKNKLMKWILDERVAYFQKSHLYIDYTLNCKLRETKIEAPENRDAEYPEKVQLDKEFWDLTLGHVLGMCRFREFLSGSAGEAVMQFWIDVQQIKHVPNKLIHKKVWLWRELQHKYFKVGGLIQLKNNQMWNVLKEGSAILEVEDRRLRDIGANEEPHFADNNKSLEKLQNAVLSVLKNYWVHRYFIHARNLQAPILAAALPQNLPSAQVTLKENILEVITALQMAQGKPILQPIKDQKETPSEKGKDLFVPSTQVDDKCVSEKHNVVTVHNDGQVSIEPTDPAVMDKMMGKCSKPDPESSTSSTPTDPPEEKQSKTNLSQKIVAAETNNESITPAQQRKPHSPKHRHKEIHGFVEANKEYLKGFMEGFSTRLPSLSPASWVLEQPKQQQNKRQNSTRKNVLVSHRETTLPSISPSPKSQRKSETPKKTLPHNVDLPQIIGFHGPVAETRVQEAMFASRGHPATRIFPVTWESRSETVTLQRKTFICSLASDQLAGGPFETFLLRTDNPYAIKSMHFWHESTIYLSTKHSTTLETYDRIRFQRAKKLVLHYLDESSSEQLNLPQQVTDNLLHLLPMERADNLLRFAQESVTMILEKAWKLHTKVDRMVFNNRCLLSKRRNLIKKILALSEARKAELVKQAEEKEDSSALKRKEKPKQERVKKEKKPKSPSNKIYSLATGTLVKEQPLAADPVKPDQQKMTKTGESKKKTKLGQLILKQQSMKAKGKKQTKQRKGKRTTTPVSKEKDAAHEKKTVPKPTVQAEKELDNCKAIAERRMWRALQLALYLCRLDCEGLPELESLILRDLCFDQRTYGSLYLAPLTIVRKEKDTKNLQGKAKRIARLRKIPASIPHGEEPDITPAKQVSSVFTKEEDKYESLPAFAKPYKNYRDNKWVIRPTKPPRSMMEIFMDPVNLEFFKRFIQFTGKDMALLLWEAVELMKNIKEAKSRQVHISHTFKKFFQNKYNFAALECKSDVLVKMSQMEKITPALLLSAQSVIAKEIETKWFEAYQETFPEVESTESSSTEESSEMSPTESEKERAFARKAREWAKAKKGVVYIVRLREQWKRVACIINRFRKALWDRPLCEQFIYYLHQKIAAEYQKYRDQGMRPSAAVEGHVSLRKVIKNKVIDMTRLPADVRFLCETERFRKLCDAATEAAIAGTYGVEDHAVVESKASLIVGCYIDSDVNPRVQINVSSEVASTISSCYHAGVLDRTLFHEATMEVLPHVIFLWQRFIQGFSSGVLTNTLTSGYQYWSHRHSSVPSDFFNLNEKMVRKQCDDDFPKLQFSLMFGLKLILPISNYYSQRVSMQELFPELVQGILYDTGNQGERMSMASPTPQMKKTKQYKKMSAKVKTLLSARRGAVVQANTKVVVVRRKEVDHKNDIPPDFMKPGVHVQPKPYKSSSSL